MAVKKGLVIVVSAPSGAGKTTLCGRLFSAMPGTRFSVSCTTRAPRPGEIDGKDYFFVSEKTFKSMIAGKEFVEWAQVHGNYYGTPKKHLVNSINKGTDVVLDVDVQGGLAIKKLFPQVLMVYIMAPSIAELRRRLISRGKDTKQVINLRVKNARKELKSLGRYDYLIVNDDLPEASSELIAVVRAEHRRVSRLSKKELKF
jgi:guanylate kinase